MRPPDCTCRFFIATHPEVEASITAELAARGLLVTPEQPHPRDLAFDDLSELRYLGAAIKVGFSGVACCHDISG